MDHMTLNDIWRFPVKSLTGESLARVVLNPGLGIPHDRRWALARLHGKATKGGDWQPKSQFEVLVRTPKLASLKCKLDERTGVFSLEGEDGFSAFGNLIRAEARREIANAVAKHLGWALDKAPVLVEAKTLGYFDSTEGPLSILNMASHRALEQTMGHPIEPQRFRMNLLVEGAKPWADLQWPGKRIRVGKTILQVTKNTGRCKATHVNPTLGLEDINILSTLKASFGHTNMGVYAKVIDGGLIQPGDLIEILD